MGWLTHWDDLIHGTVVFGAAVPLGVALLLGWRLPGGLWVAMGGALVAPFFWIFGRPSWPLRGSDHAMVIGLVVAILLVVVGLGQDVPKAPRTTLHVIKELARRAVVWAGLGWLLYPAWLAADGGTGRRLLVTGAMGFSMAAWAALVEFFARESREKSGSAFRLTPATWVPPSIALSVLLQFGGSTRFAQCAGALAAATGGVCLLLLRDRAQAGLRPLAAVWGMLSALLAWSGWLFAEIQIGPTLALLLTPFAALAARRLPLPRHTEFLEQLWDALAATVIAVLVIGAGWIKYREGGDSSGY